MPFITSKCKCIPVCRLKGNRMETEKISWTYNKINRHHDLLIQQFFFFQILKYQSNFL